MSHINNFLNDAILIIKEIDHFQIEKMITLLCELRERGGRLFFLGVGGSAANCSHAVNDFRKLASIEAYTPVDNVSELTARVNDEGWHTVFVEWLRGSNLKNRDAVFVFSVGGGNKEENISANIVHALEYAKDIGAMIFGVVGRDGGYTAKVANACVIIPCVNKNTITFHTEAFHGIIWHLIISDPRIQRMSTKWESLSDKITEII